ncbi:T9SS-dependent choice-of-anchor J family protein [Psychroserpens ponticola]|uniref:Choice-of-anchor J domain-containing protein n=1 Tax=Psychroserpens ponticola TaxID=2932268 RepID=A0ABY7RUM0_9FLAO|nr:choice-of-anchor J domain-containing protein [Psychroserpens ponticola]WCO00508.1 choice-of-anchor J domain-containing protein [Psychroserpens ponticola]
MKKITFVMTFILLWSFNSYGQFIDEDFESGTFPPAGWIDEAGPAHVPNGTADNDWAATTARSNSPTNSAFFNDFTVNNDKWLISPLIDLSGAVNPELLYWDNVNFAEFAGTHDVLWSEDYSGSGDPTLATWTSLYNTVVEADEDTWMQRGPFAISPIVGTGDEVYIAFHYVGNNDAEWFIDDVLVRNALTCTPAIGSVTLVEDCGNQEFSIEVEVTSLGDSGTVTISNTGGEADETVNSVPTTVTIGPFTTGTSVGVTLEHDSNAACNVFLGNTVDSCPPPTPANDDFADAQAIVCGSMMSGETDSATLDEASANPTTAAYGVDSDAPNVWFSYDSATEGAADVTISLCGSNYDTSVAVYTGTSGSLTLVAGFEDNEAACGVFSVQSEGTFSANGTDTYYISVEGYSAFDTGNYVMNVTCVPLCTAPQTNMDCASATALSVDGMTTTQDNTCATVNPTQLNCDLYHSIADVWYTFDAPASGQVNIVTALGTASAAHIAIYEGTCGALVELECEDDATSSVSLTDLNAAETYFIQLWNNGTEEGTINITLSDASLSLNTIENENAFTYFPNPVKNELTLKAQNSIQNVSVFNMLGQEVLRAKPNTLETNLNMNDLSQGAYFVQVTINNVTETVRILKQ